MSFFEAPYPPAKEPQRETSPNRVQYGANRKRLPFLTITINSFRDKNPTIEEDR